VGCPQAKSLDWNGSLAAGPSAGLGFNANGPAATPSAFTLNGTACTVA
jgi:hypothetical protein